MADPTIRKRRRGPSNRVTIDEVARVAGVSTMSVSRAMRGVEGLSAERRAAILDIARALGYEPSSLAGSLAAANSTLIGVSVPTLNDEVFGDIFDGMRTVFTRYGFQTVFDTTDYARKNEDEWIERILAWRPAGLVLSGVDQSRQAKERLRAARIPVLQIWDVTYDPIDICVGIDHEAAGHAMADHLLELGYRRPAYIGVRKGFDARAEKRAKGFKRGLAAAGVELVADKRISNARSFSAGEDGVTALLDEVPVETDAIYFMNDHMALGGIIACEARGMKIPDDIGIAGFNDLALNRVLPLRVTTSATPRSTMGSKGAQALIARIKGVKRDPVEVLPVELKPGLTTRSAIPYPSGRS
ncbi:LacI family DNA-binding transcriptional regulator [Ahrensia sp. R2A130]|uniref:LacI family DNA-binding transcriptional regulator n=1 Tax=Ahrensia sp. R2A130 TaxID=744979 RepID=UPI0001E083A2|nr:LacI family DNA-binding transcriptional regulator [Ahrensia sp. R2A130]EFL90502.1 LacI family transcription regulator [Ahrensia sp. R2A130]